MLLKKASEKKTDPKENLEEAGLAKGYSRGN